MKKLSSLLLAAILTTACAIDPYTGEEKIANTGWGAGIGAASGAAIGALTGGRKGALIGAGAGAVVGGGIGYYMDTQEKKLRQRLETTGVKVQRQGNNIKLIMPGNITFATDSANINDDFYAALDSVGIVLKEFGDTSINISGYADSSGGDFYNQQLSERRANSVTSYIVRTGVAHGRIQARGFGERFPVASNDTAMGRSQNRRVEVTIRPR
ncbi:MAG: OmpA family protein [Methylococcales symbiont of Hymedesmia sp. n. MRB-2018]|nr:MAG: OmpA family protein [Methylococcales symbiont of Hymedesmia sp. n. MRB-2018]